MSALTYAECLRRLDYDPETGIFRWREPTNIKLSRGEIAGHLSAQGYCVIGLHGCVYKAHRLAWFWMTGDWPTVQIDHRDRNKANNSWANLRPATTSQNKANGDRYAARNSDLPKGVYRAGRCKSKPFVAQIRVRGKCFYLGIFASAEDASNAYKAAAVQHFGEFANA